jgi:hypothetical protein
VECIDSHDCSTSFACDPANHRCVPV